MIPRQIYFATVTTLLLINFSGNFRKRFVLCDYNFFKKLISASEVQISPESKIIDVNEGKSYTIEFIEDNSTDIRECYYISEKISGYFPVVKKDSNGTTVRISVRF